MKSTTKILESKKTTTTSGYHKLARYMEAYFALLVSRIYILEFLSILKNREEFEGGLEKRKGKGGKRRKKEKSDKTHVKIPL